MAISGIIRSPVRSLASSGLAGDYRDTYVYTNSEARSLVGSMQVKPDATRKGHIDTFIGSLKTAGVWSKLDVLWLPAAHAEQAGQLNWKAPGTYTLLPISSPTFTTDRGYAGNGTTSYLDTQWAPSSGVNFTQDSACLGVYVNATGSNAFGTAAMNAGCGDGTNSVQLMTWTTGSGTAGRRINDGTSANFGAGILTRLGCTVIERTNASTRQIVRNGSVTANASTQASTGRSTRPLFIGANNNNGTTGAYSTDRHAAVFAGSQLSAGEHSDFYNALATYLTAIGAN